MKHLHHLDRINFLTKGILQNELYLSGIIADREKAVAEYMANGTTWNRIRELRYEIGDLNKNITRTKNEISAAKKELEILQKSSE